MIMLENVSVRLIDNEDAEATFQLIDSNRPRLVRYLPITCKENQSLQLTRQYIENRKLDASNRTVFTCVIEDLASNKLAGMFIIKKLDWHAGSCEFGYFICQEFEGTGIISRVIEKSVEHCFTKLRLQTIDIITGPDNPGSIRVAEKNGFEQIKLLKGGHKDQYGSPLDVILFRRKKD